MSSEDPLPCSLAIRPLCDPACEPVRAQASRREHTVDVCCALELLGVWQPSIHWQPCDLRGRPSAEFSGIVCDLLNFRLTQTPRILESEPAVQRCVRASRGSRECSALACSPSSLALSQTVTPNQSGTRRAHVRAGVCTIPQCRRWSGVTAIPTGGGRLNRIEPHSLLPYPSNLTALPTVSRIADVLLVAVT